jgi:excisionase family DNA binding protein
METERELITVPELADYLRVPRSWVYSRTRTDSLPCVKIGKYRRFRLRDVLDHLETRGGVETRGGR